VLAPLLSRIVWRGGVIVLLALALGGTGCRQLTVKEPFPCSQPGHNCPAPYQCGADLMCRLTPVTGDAAMSDAADGGSGDRDAAPTDATDGGSGDRDAAPTDAADSGSGDGGGGDAEGGVVAPPGSIATGSPCSLSADCVSKACVDGVCCQNACTGACKACAFTYTGQPNGTCALATAGMDPHDDCTAGTPESCGNDGTCDGAGACRKYGSSQVCGTASCSGTQFQPVRTCTGTGTCGAAAPVDCGAYPCTSSGCAKPCTGDTDCPSQSYCLSGMCKAKKTNGDPCTAGNECSSAQCVDSVCCATTCTGACMSCNQMATGQTSGQCNPVQAGQDPDGDCPTDAPTSCGRDGTCDGKGACNKYGSTTKCQDPSCAGSLFTAAGTCNNGACSVPAAVDCKQSACTAAEGCRQGCTSDADCAASSYCAGASCAARKMNGSTCSVGDECTSLACVDGVCCESACTAKCYACSNAKTGQASGKCAPVTAGTDMDGECPDTPMSGCGTEGVCDGAGNCRLWAKGTPCSTGMCNASGNYVPAGTCDGAQTCQVPAPNVCAPNICVATGCSQTCTTNNDCVGSTYCAGTMCAAKKAQGSTCANAAECASNYCVDGYCCDGVCNGTCNACSNGKTGQANGHCAPIPVGFDPDMECTQGPTCGLDGTCNGSNGCRITPLGTPCGTAACSGNMITPVGSCDGISTCTPGSTQACPGGFTCASSTACRTSCTAATSATDCAAGNYCSGTSCAAKKGAGISCGGNIECASGSCVDGVCCSSACALAAASAGMCMGCSAAATGMPSGTCAARAGATATACPAANPTACVNLQSDPANCNSCGHVCSTSGLPAGSTAACRYGACGASCTAAQTQLCIRDSGTRVCTPTVWGFENNDSMSWYNSAETTSTPSTSQHHSGGWSLSISPSSYPTIPASVSSQSCVDSTGTDVGTMDVRGKTFSAWVFVGTSSSSYAGTMCRLRATDRNFTDSLFGASATKSPIVPGGWFQLTATFPATVVEANIYSLYVDCMLPSDWTFGDPSKVWYIDDVQIN
jgi:hypothetical protein